MRSLTASVVIAAALAACHLQAANHVGGGVLGRVVIYRNGVAFYERSATVTNGEVTVQVPRERVDDFLKSLTVVDRATGKPLAVTIPRQQSSDGGSLTMTLETADARDAQVLLTYVTEAPAWKPSYRVVVGKDGKVMLEAWAVVDNTTSEDWKGVLVGVGASSALAFRYDLWSVRQIDRDLLQGEQKFAIAPPTGVSPYAGATGAEELTTLDASEIHGSGKDGLGRSSGGAGSTENTYVLEGRTPSGAATGGAGAGGAAPSNAIRGTVTDSKSGERLAGVTVVATDGKTEVDTIADEHGAFTLAVPPGLYTLTYYYSDATASRSNVRVIANQTTTVNQLLAPGTSEGETITITGAAPIIDQGSTKTGMTVTSDFATNVATGRSFGAAGSATAPRPMEPPPTQRGDDKLAVIASKVKQERRDVVVEVHGAPGNEQAAEARGAAVKNKLVDAGVPASRIHIVPKLEAGGSDSVRVLAVAPATSTEPSAPPSAQSHSAGGDTPVGESHFMAERPMTVRAGSSAMVAMLHGETTGGVVYLYDPISDRGDPRFAFKAVRLDNPTGDTLEPGPVTVYGDGRFIGEGITEPVPPHAAVVVPFALDKQVVVERSGAEQDRIARLVTAQRGVVTAELQHRRDTRFKLTSRLALPSTVYLRHRLEAGWTLVEAPPRATRVGDSQLFEIALGAGETREVVIAEATPVERRFELSSAEALGMMKVFVDEPAASPALKAQIDALLATHRGAADLTDKLVTLREELVEYRQRSGELHAQLVTLKAVRTGGDLMAALRARLSEISDRIQKVTLELVATQDKLMLTRVKLQNQLADLRLSDQTRRIGAR